MSIRIDEALSTHARALNLHVQRSEILAANLANESTPGFQARDIDFVSEMQRLDSPFNAGVNAGVAANGEQLQLQYRIPTQPSLDGNTVELSVEQAEFSKNATDFQTSLTFLTMQFRGLKQAIEGR